VKFDKTFIAIRQRNVLEIFDLALHVSRVHFRSLFWLLVIGALPWIALDIALTYWMMGDFDYPLTYYWVMVLLVVNQAQVGTSFMTYYLGQAMFVGQPGIWEVVKSVIKSSSFFIWVHGGLRMVIPAVLVALMLDDSSVDALLATTLFFLPGVVIIGLMVRAFRPFVSEILLLERTPIRKKKSLNQIYFGRRSNSLHGANGSELFGRFITSILFGVPLAFSCYSMFIIIDSSLNIRANSETTYAPYYFAISLWIVAGFMSIVRFLSYIDIRIRQEGWAVELRMRAEGLRLQEAFE
jgi:hypothetical protein